MQCDGCVCVCVIIGWIKKPGAFLFPRLEFYEISTRNITFSIPNIKDYIDKP